MGHERGHLLARLLGGSGDEYENLVTLFRNANSPVMRDLERKVADAVLAGEIVRYRVSPIYNGTDLIPRAVTLRAVGKRGFQLHVSVLNIP
jgi:hypothetical protein